MLWYLVVVGCMSNSVGVLDTWIVYRFSLIRVGVIDLVHFED